jgi:patatin-like phospholipase/acyl hydrolase
MIRHLVLSGGGVFGFSCFGAIRESCRRGLLEINNIDSIHATSVGTMMGVFLALKYDMGEVEEYLVKRPWNRVFQFTLPTLLSAVERRGIFDQSALREMFLPFFLARDLSIDMTLREFYDVTRVDFHCISTEIGEFKTVNFSHKTHPEWKLMDAVYCSSCLPILFAPYFHVTAEGKNEYYMDGGILDNYPVQACLDALSASAAKAKAKAKDSQNESDLEEEESDDKPCLPIQDSSSILGICKKNNREILAPLDPVSSTLLDYILYLLNKIIYKDYKPPAQLENEITIELPHTNIYDVYLASTFPEERRRLIQLGVQETQNQMTLNEMK